jgi:methanogenic corrinoid protein MtbC1
MVPEESDLEVVNLINALINMDRIAIRQILSPVDGSLIQKDLIDEVIVMALEEIGRRWEEGTLAISQVYMAGVLIEEIIITIYPTIESSPQKQVKLATVVLDDYHMLGERIVASHLIGAGYTPIRYGRKDVQELLPLVYRDNLKYLLISTLMLSSALKIKEVTAGLTGKEIKVIVGGAPFRLDPNLGIEVGADRVCFTASDAVTAIRELEGKS